MAQKFIIPAIVALFSTAVSSVSVEYECKPMPGVAPDGECSGDDSPNCETGKSCEITIKLGEDSVATVSGLDAGCTTPEDIVCTGTAATIVDKCACGMLEGFAGVCTLHVKNDFSSHHIASDDALLMDPAEKMGCIGVGATTEENNTVCKLVSAVVETVECLAESCSLYGMVDDFSRFQAENQNESKCTLAIGSVHVECEAKGASKVVTTDALLAAEGADVITVETSSGLFQCTSETCSLTAEGTITAGDDTCALRVSRLAGDSISCACPDSSLEKASCAYNMADSTLSCDSDKCGDQPSSVTFACSPEAKCKDSSATAMECLLDEECEIEVSMGGAAFADISGINAKCAPAETKYDCTAPKAELTGGLKCQQLKSADQLIGMCTVVLDTVAKKDSYIVITGGAMMMDPYGKTACFDSAKKDFTTQDEVPFCTADGAVLSCVSDSKTCCLYGLVSKDMRYRADNQIAICTYAAQGYSSCDAEGDIILERVPVDNVAGDSSSVVHSITLEGTVGDEFICSPKDHPDQCLLWDGGSVASEVKTCSVEVGETTDDALFCTCEDGKQFGAACKFAIADGLYACHLEECGTRTTTTAVPSGGWSTGTSMAVVLSTLAASLIPSMI